MPEQADQPSYFSLWNFVKQRNAALSSMSQLTMESPLRNDLPLYPSLPFSIKVCESLSKVSSAFNDMAIAGQLSIQMIGIIATLSTMMKNESGGSLGLGSPSTSSPASSGPNSPSERNLLHIIADLRCLSMLGTVPIEHLLCHGLIGFCLRLHFREEKLGDDFDEIIQGLEDTLVGRGKPRPQQDLEKFYKEHKDCLLWIAFAAADALEMSPPFSRKSMVLEQTLDRYPTETSRWETLDKILRRFLWNDFLAQHWKRRWEVATRRRLKAR
ncbi:hypothetical protein PV08_10543 [Exophiala spinifera]|uniref:Uncharacterized protein n=1 Tax=Exophiala spinifera TaxID=91928 RepID=A0A0D2AX09_9EURO|nr:uncharacterized protein PV08_10543 [Exophiala spinifera]KIW11243.1 hypothetical protein PV08_10543 [Exophiala spinifera]